MRPPGAPVPGAPWGGLEGLDPHPHPASGLTTLHLPMSLLSLQQKSARCAQPAHHYPPSRAIPARLGCRGQWSGGPRAPAVQESFGGLGPATAPMLGPGSLWATPTLSSLALVDMTVRGGGGQESQTTAHGAFALWDKEGSLVSRTGTASLGPSGKKDPGWCRDSTLYAFVLS